MIETEKKTPVKGNRSKVIGTTKWAECDKGFEITAKPLKKQTFKFGKNAEGSLIAYGAIIEVTVGDRPIVITIKEDK